MTVLLLAPTGASGQGTGGILRTAARAMVDKFPAEMTIHIDPWALRTIDDIRSGRVAELHDTTSVSLMARAAEAEIAEQHHGARCFSQSTPGCLPPGANGLLTVSLPVVDGDTARLSASVRMRTAIRTARYPEGRSSSADFNLVLVCTDGVWKVTEVTLTRSS